MSKLFYFKDKDGKEKIHSYTVAEAFGRGVNYPKGRFGIELEMECRNQLPTNVPPTWVTHNDGSLRAPAGGSTMEYVLNVPLDLDDASKATQDLFNTIVKHGSILRDDSYRTSTHVHLNVNDWRLGRVASFACLWFIYEDLMAAFSGEMRRGNLFALRAIDAKHIIENFTSMVALNEYGRFREGNAKYAALNGYTMTKFGSLEIRTMRGLTEAREVIQWLHILDCFYRASERFESDPRRIFQEVSMQSPDGFLKSIIGNELYSIILNDPHVKWTDEELIESAYVGIRTCQDIAYATDWDQVIPAPIDPFGRKKKVSKGPALRNPALEVAIQAMRDIEPPPVVEAGGIAQVPRREGLRAHAEWLGIVEAPPRVFMNRVINHQGRAVRIEDDNQIINEGN